MIRGRTGVSRILAALAILVALTATADAQSYPTRLIKLMHGFPPGGNNQLRLAVRDNVTGNIGTINALLTE